MRAATALTEKINELWALDGGRTAREIAKTTTPRIGHTTVWALLAGQNKAPSRWETLETLWRAMNADPAEVRPFWEKAVAEDAALRAATGRPRSTHIPSDAVAVADPFAGLITALDNLAAAMRECAQAFRQGPAGASD